MGRGRRKRSLLQVPLKNYATPVGTYIAPTVQFQLQGTITAGDYIELAWLDQHFNYQVTGADTLATAINNLAFAITFEPSRLDWYLLRPTANTITLTYLGAPGVERQPNRRLRNRAWRAEPNPGRPRSACSAAANRRRPGRSISNFGKSGGRDRDSASHAEQGPQAALDLCSADIQPPSFIRSGFRGQHNELDCYRQQPAI